MFLLTALALGDPSVKIEDVTPKIFPSGPLFPTEVSNQLNPHDRFILWIWSLKCIDISLVHALEW
jgi:hypothetical protein